jgi:hypothetical protein
MIGITTSQLHRGAWIGVALLLLVVGCSKSGPDLAPVSGRVTLDGQPIAVADVYFHPEGEKSPSVGRTDADGRYVLGYKRGVEGGMVGWNTVRIQTVGGPPLVPPRYNRDSDLRREVTSGKNTFDFELTTAQKN